MNGKNGFTIIELVVTIVISGIFIYGASLTLRQLMFINERANDLAIANSTARNITESLRSAGYLSLSDGTINFTTNLPDELADPRDASYTITTESPGLKRIKFDIDFTINGRAQEQQYTTFIGEVGVGQY